MTGITELTYLVYRNAVLLLTTSSIHIRCPQNLIHSRLFSYSKRLSDAPNNTTKPSWARQLMFLYNLFRSMRTQMINRTPNCFTFAIFPYEIVAAWCQTAVLLTALLCSVQSDIHKGSLRTVPANLADQRFLPNNLPLFLCEA